MKIDHFKPWIIGILSIFIILSLAITLQIGGLAWNKFFSPRKENVRREVYESTRSYNEGKVQDLSNYYLQYIKAESNEEREAIKATVRHQFANYSVEKAPKEYQQFLRKCKGI